MIQKIKTLILSAAALLLLGVPALVPATAMAAGTDQTQINQNLGCGANIDFTQTTCTTTDQGTTLNGKISTIINLFSAVIAAVAVIMIIYGGFKYVSSGGKEESVKGAKSTIMYALIGLVIVALAQVIVKFVLNKASS